MLTCTREIVDPRAAIDERSRPALAELDRQHDAYRGRFR